MHNGDYLLSFVDLTLLQYVPGASISARMAVAEPAKDEGNGTEHADNDEAHASGTFEIGASEDDVLADTARSIYLDQ